MMLCRSGPATHQHQTRLLGILHPDLSMFRGTLSLKAQVDRSDEFAAVAHADHVVVAITAFAEVA